MKPPQPVCRLFLVCNKIVQQGHDTLFVNLPDTVHSRTYPFAHVFDFFVRWTSGHGTYDVEIQLRTLEGDVVWRHELAEKYPMRDPLTVYDLKILHLAPVFPKLGKYELVVMANGADIARAAFSARERV